MISALKPNRIKNKIYTKKKKKHLHVTARKQIVV
jgi:hypothetical protein